MLAGLSIVAALLGITMFVSAPDAPPSAPSAESVICQPDYWGC